jgi:hypothetical protein
MARGWESKAVADQIEEGDSRRSKHNSSKKVSPEMRQQEARLSSLLLSKSRLLQQLERARHPSHRDVLLKGLKAIEKEIDKASSKPAPSSNTQKN